jgi:hypothetical protein
MDGLEDLRHDHGIEVVWIAIDQHGDVTREIGFAANGTVVHRFPGSGSMGRYGIFDLARFAPDTVPANLSREEFDIAFYGETGTARHSNSG